jgi:hypothetical protein
VTSLGARDWTRTDFYAVLGLDERATAAEIDAAYKRLAKELHPDTRPEDPDAATRFAAIARAREILADPWTRQAYDASRAEVRRPDPGAAPVWQNLAPPPPPKPSRPVPPRVRMTIGVVLLLGALAMAVWTVVAIRGAGGSESTVATTGVVAADGGDRTVTFRTRQGSVVTTRLPDRLTAAPGARITVRYRPDDPTAIDVRDSNLLVLITLGVASLKLAVGGVLVLAYPRLRARFPGSA